MATRTRARLHPFETGRYEVVEGQRLDADEENSFTERFTSNRTVLTFDMDDKDEEGSEPRAARPQTHDRTDLTPFTRPSEIEIVLNEQYPYPKINRVTANMLDYYLNSVDGPVFTNKMAAKAFLYAAHRLEGTEQIKRERLERGFAALIEDWRPHAQTLKRLHERDQREILQLLLREQKYRTVIVEEEIETRKEESDAFATVVLAEKLLVEGLTLSDLPYLLAFEEHEQDERDFICHVEQAEREDLWELLDEIVSAMMEEGNNDEGYSNTLASHQSMMSGTYSAASLRRQSQLYYHPDNQLTEGGRERVAPLSISDLKQSRISRSGSPKSPSVAASGTQYHSRWEENSLRLFSHSHHKSSRTFESDVAAHNVIKERVGMKELGDARRADASESKRIIAQRTREENLRLRRALEMSKRAELQKCFAHVVKSRDHFKNQRKLFDAHREEYQQSRRKAASTRYMAYKWDLQASKGGVEEADKLSKIMGERDRFSRAASASAKDEPQRPPMSAMHQRAIAGLAPLPTFTRPPSSQFGSRPPTRPTRLAPLSQTKSQSQFTLNTPTRPSTALLLTNDSTPSEMPRAHSAGGSKLKGHYFTNMPVTSDGLIVRKGAVATVPLIKEQRSSARKKMLPNIVHPVEAKMVQLAQTFAVMIKSGQVGPSGSSEDGSPTNRIKLEVITAPAPPLFVMLPAYAAVECSMGPLLSADQATVTSKGSLYEQAAWFFIKSKESVAAAGLPEGQEASMMAEADRLLLAGERIMIKLRRMGSEAAATESENLRSIVLSSNRGFGASSPFAYEHTLHNLSILRGKAMAAMLRATRQLTQALRVLEEVAVLESNPPPLPKPQRHSISSPPLSGSVFTDELGYSSEELSPIRSDAHRHLRSPLVKHPPPSPYLPHSTSSPLRSPRECALTVDTKVSHQPDASKSIVRTNPHNNQPEEILHDYTRGVRGGTFGRARKPIGDGDKRTKAAAAAVESARLHTPPRSPTRSPTSDSLHPPKHLHSPTMVASVPTAVPNPVTLANLASVSVALGHASEGLAYGRRSCTAVTKQLEANIASVLRALKKRDVIRKRDRQQDHETTAASEGTLIAVTVPFAEPLELAVSALMAVAAAQAGQVSTVSAGSMPSERVSAPTTYRLAADLAATVLAPDHPISQHCRRCVEQISK